MAEEKTFKIVNGDISDGYHTFGELYEHRCLLFCALARAHPHLVWRSGYHADGSSYPGWFIAGMDLPTGPITYHLPDRLWGLLHFARTLERAPAWDGHTSPDVVDRLRNWCAKQAAGTVAR